MQRTSLPAVLLTLWLAPAMLLGEQLSVRGTIELPDGRPAAGVEVQLHRQTNAYEFNQLLARGRHYPEPLDVTSAAADGSYEIQAPEAGMWHLYVAASGYRPMEFNFWPLLGDREVATLELIEERTVRVRISGADGSPLPGAHVRASSPPAPDRPTLLREYWRPAYRQAIADELGIAQIGRGAEEAIDVRAWAPGHAETERVGVQDRTVQLELTAATLRRIKIEAPTGGPLAEVVVRIGERRWPLGMTGESGILELPTPKSGEFKIHALAADGRRFEDRLDVEEWPQNEPRVVHLLPLATYSGRLVDRDSQTPVAGGFAWIGGRPADFVRTGSTGGYSLSAESARTRLWIWGAATGFLNEATQADTAAATGPTIALQASLDVRGVVVDELDQPIADATVTPSVDLTSASGMRNWQAGGWLAPTASDAQGQFRLMNLHSEAAYVVEARKPGFAPGKVSLVNPKVGTTTNLRIALEMGRSLVGRAVDSAGVPVGGARVELTPAPSSNDPRTYMNGRALGEDRTVRSFSDETGAFALHDLGVGLFDLRATAPGFAASEVPTLEVLQHTTETDIGEVTLEPGFEIEGRVTNAGGSALEGAQVSLEVRPEGTRFFVIGGPQHDEPVATTDANGFFRIVDRGEGEKLDLSFKLSGYARTLVSSVAAPTTQPISVRMERASTLRGEVVDPRGRPIADARVSVQVTEIRAMSSSTRGIGNAKTNADGRFVIENVDPGEIQLEAQAKGFGQARISSLRVEPGEVLDGLRIEMQSGASITGRITGPGGRPVSGAQIMIMESSTGFSRSFIGGGMSDGDGRYTLDGVPHGSRSLTVQHEDYRQKVRDIEVGAGETVIDITLDSGVAIAGRVVDDNGQAVEGATINLQATAFALFGNSGATSDGSGAFELGGLAEGTYRLEVRKEGFAGTGLDTVEVGPEGVYGLEVRLEQGGSIVGRLYGLEPADYSSVLISTVKQPHTYATGLVRRDGSYRVDDLAPGEYTVQASVQTSGLQADGHATVDGAGLETILDLEFGGGLTLTGTVLRSGEPLAGSRIALTGLDVGTTVTGLTSSEGRFELKGLDPGRFRITVQNWSTGLHHEEEFDLQSDRDVVVRIDTARVSGFVRDADSSEPLKNASVQLNSLEPTARPFAFPMAATMITDSAGFFKFTEASAGSYRLIAQKQGYAPEELGITVVGASDQEGVELLLSPTAGARIYVTMPDGRPAQNFLVSVLDANARSLISGMHTAGEDGGTELSLGAGTWEILVGAGGTAVSRAQITVPGEPVAVRLASEARLNIRLPALEGEATMATVGLFDASGRPFSGSLWMQTTNEWPMVQGRAVVQGLSAGSWTVRVQAPDGRTWEAQVQLVSGDNPELVLG